MKKIICVFFFTLTTLMAQFKAGGIVGQMAKPVAGAESFSRGNKIYIIGGYAEETQANVSWIQTYDVNSQQWYNQYNLAYERYGLSASIKYDTIYCFGGVHSADSINRTIETWDIGFSSASEISDSLKDFNRIFSTSKIIGDNLYVIGGNPYFGADSTDFSYIIEYNTSTKSITYEYEGDEFLGDLPEQQMAAEINGNIYLFGGVMNGLSQAIYKFNPAEHKLEKLDVELASPRAGGVAVKGVNGNDVYIIGGYTEQSAAVTTVEVFAVEGSEYNISEVQSIIYPRKQLIAENIGGQIYIMGGLDPYNSWVDEIEIFDYPVTVVNETETAGMDFRLEQNYPNPFNPTTKIKYSIVADAFHASPTVLLKIYDILGNEITTLVNEKKEPGRYEVEFDANDLTAGIYVYQLKVTGSSKTNNFTETKKMVLLK